MGPEIWLAIFITGGRINTLAADIYPSQATCLASFHITEAEWPGFPYGRFDPANIINGVCLKVEAAVVTKPRTLREIMGVTPDRRRQRREENAANCEAEGRCVNPWRPSHDD